MFELNYIDFNKTIFSGAILNKITEKTKYDNNKKYRYIYNKFVNIDLIKYNITIEDIKSDENILINNYILEDNLINLLNTDINLLQKYYKKTPFNINLDIISKLNLDDLNIISVLKQIKFDRNIIDGLYGKIFDINYIINTQTNLFTYRDIFIKYVNDNSDINDDIIDTIVNNTYKEGCSSILYFINAIMNKDIKKKILNKYIIKYDNISQFLYDIFVYNPNNYLYQYIDIKTVLDKGIKETIQAYYQHVFDANNKNIQYIPIDFRTNQMYEKIKDNKNLWKYCDKKDIKTRILNEISERLNYLNNIDNIYEDTEINNK